MNPVANSLILTSMLIVVDIFSGAKKRISTYLLIFMLSLGIGYACRAHADIAKYEYLISPSEPDYVDPKLPIWKKFLLHVKFAQSNYKEAEDYVWWHISDKYSDNEKAKLCFESVLVGVVPPHPLGKAIGITLLLFKEYGLDCMERYNYVTRLLHKAEYHVEMYEFYSELEDGGMDDLRCRGYVCEHVHVDENGNECREPDGTPTCKPDD